MLYWSGVAPLLAVFSNTSREASMLQLPINRSLKTPLIRQIYDQLRQRIVCGELRAGALLPSTRQLAADLHISRIVIIEAYEQLLAEGYIESRQGAGTYVAEGACLKTLQQVVPVREDRGSEQPVHMPEHSMLAKPPLIDFRSGLPALDLFPRKLWSQLTRSVCEQASASAFGYVQPEGCI